MAFKGVHPNFGSASATAILEIVLVGKYNVAGQ